jgi:hypothetical protein
LQRSVIEIRRSVMARPNLSVRGIQHSAVSIQLKELDRRPTLL